jgi:hypothetical protein
MHVTGTVNRCILVERVYTVTEKGDLAVSVGRWIVMYAFLGPRGI